MTRNGGEVVLFLALDIIPCVWHNWHMYGHPVLRLWRAVKWLHAYTIMENDIEVHVLTKHADIPAMKRNARDNKLKIIIYNSELKNKMIVL